MRYPSFLPADGTIVFTAPSFGCTGPFAESFDYALQRFREMGHATKETSDCRRADGLGISSSPERCARELIQAYCDIESDAMISCGGGEMMCRTLDYIDFDRIRIADPKWFMGLSDNTNFTFLLTTLCDVASIYGPCAGAFGMEPLHPALLDAYKLITGKARSFRSYDGYQKTMFVESDNPREPYQITEPLKLRTVPEGKSVYCAGRLIGGCLDVLANLCGTKYDRVEQFTKRYADDGFIWYLEACDLNVWSICRALWELDNAGWFKGVKGFLIGRPLCSGQTDGGMDQYTAVTEILAKYNVPIIMDADLGHLPPSMPLVNGALALVTCANNSLKVSFDFV